MNLGKLEKLADDLKARIEALQPKESPPPLVFRYCDDVNPNAPSGTTADPDGDDENARDTLIMLPPGYRGPLKEGLYSHAEYLAMLEGKNGN
jgi:hypothetical protein